jgi:3',5'-cyclic AMP phosphodiesterase CpdA
MHFTLAHLSDPHLPIPAGALRPLCQLAGKRSLAYLGWLRKRAGTMSPEPLLADIAAHRPDHIAVTGDLTNLALPGEFAAARDWLARLGPPARVSAIPGNHDATVRVSWQAGIGRWRPWMADDGSPAEASGGAPGRFPFLRRRGPAALIGLCSAVPTLPGSAAGWLGADQLARLSALLEAVAREGLFRIVMVHHPPLPGRGGWRRELRDREALRAVLRRDGAELVLHGHHHAVLRAEVEGRAGPIPVLGAPLALRSRRDGPAGWHLHRIARDESRGWRLDTTVRGWDAASGAFRTAETWTVPISSGGAPPCGSRRATGSG